MVLAANRGLFRREGHGNPYTGEVGLVHRRPHDADDGVGVAVEGNGLAEGPRIVGVVSLPEFVAEDDLAVLAWIFSSGRKTRPWMGSTPRAEKKSVLTGLAVMDSGFAWPVMSKLAPV